MANQMLAVVNRWRGRHEVLLVFLFVGVLLPFLVFLKLADEVWEAERIRWDDALLNLIHAHANPVWDTTFISITRLGGPGILLGILAVVVAYLIYSRRRGVALYLAVSVLGASGLNLIAKAVCHRARPTLFVSPAPESTYSFPSSHAMVSAAFSVAFVLLLWPTRWRWAALAGGTFLVGAVGMSRLYLGVHFPSDVLGGWCASTAWVAGTYSILHRRLEMNAIQEPSPTGGDAVRAAPDDTR